MEAVRKPPESRPTPATVTTEHLHNMLEALDQRDAKDAAARFAERYVTRPSGDKHRG